MPGNFAQTRKDLEAWLNSGDPQKVAAAKEFLTKLDAETFAAPDFTVQMLAYYSVEPPCVEAAIENLEAFCKRTVESDDKFAKTVIKCFVDRVISEWFKIDFQTLTSIGIILGNSNYEEQGVRCVKHAGTLFTQAKKR